MRRIIFASLLLFTLYVLVLGSTFNKSCSVSGGSPQQLSAVMTTCGYASTVTVTDLTICNPVGSANTLYVGGSNVSASNGFALPAGVCKTSYATSDSDPVHTDQFYLFVATTQNEHISARSK